MESDSYKTMGVCVLPPLPADAFLNGSSEYNTLPAKQSDAAVPRPRTSSLQRTPSSVTSDAKDVVADVPQRPIPKPRTNIPPGVKPVPRMLEQDVTPAAAESHPPVPAKRNPRTFDQAISPSAIQRTPPVPAKRNLRRFDQAIIPAAIERTPPVPAKRNLRTFDQAIIPSAIERTPPIPAKRNLRTFDQAINPAATESTPPTFDQEINPATARSAPSMPNQKIRPMIDPYFDSSTVYSLNSDNFGCFLGSSDITMVMFYTPGNEQTKWHARQFAVAAKRTKRKNHAYAAVDCSEHPCLCTQQCVPDSGLMFRLFSGNITVGTIREATMFTFDQIQKYVEMSPILDKNRKPTYPT